MIYRKYIKRLLDIAFALILMVLLAPLMGIIAVLVCINLGRPVFFVHERPGRNEEIFRLIKFRTMKEEKDKTGKGLEDEHRLISFGRKLRSTSLDELPELVNILKGDMSFVGPRPLLIEYLSLYNDKHKKRHLARPGLTGYAQVMGRNRLSWTEKFDMDIEYTENLNFLWDLKIIFNTIRVVISRQGVSSRDSITAKKFDGYHAGERNE